MFYFYAHMKPPSIFYISTVAIRDNSAIIDIRVASPILGTEVLITFSERLDQRLKLIDMCYSKSN